MPAGKAASIEVPAYMTIFNIVRNQYFFLGEEILSAMPMAAIKLVSALLLIEMSEPGSEGRTRHWLMLVPGGSNMFQPLGWTHACDTSALCKNTLCETPMYTIH